MYINISIYLYYTEGEEEVWSIIDSWIDVAALLSGDTSKRDLVHCPTEILIGWKQLHQSLSGTWMKYDKDDLFLYIIQRLMTFNIYNIGKGIVHVEEASWLVICHPHVVLLDKYTLSRRLWVAPRKFTLETVWHSHTVPRLKWLFLSYKLIHGSRSDRMSHVFPTLCRENY